MPIAVHVDYETRSRLDLKQTGAHVYAASPTTELLCAVWIIDRDGVEETYTWDVEAGGDMPAPVREALEDPIGKVCGHNQAFEAAIDEYLTGPRMGWPVVPIARRDCTLARCAVQSLPLDLARACAALGVPVQKDDQGRRLMLRMCKPAKATGEFPYSPEMLKRLLDYCVTDVRAEICLDKALRPLSWGEDHVWRLDQEINNRGVRIDVPFVQKALAVADNAVAALNEEMRTVTGGAVPECSKVAKLREWAKGHGVEFPIVVKKPDTDDEYEAEVADKEVLTRLSADESVPAIARQAFKLRLAAAKASTKKLVKMQAMSLFDGRARGNLQYHGAHTGRWAGRGIQLQNLPRSSVEDWDASFATLDAIGPDEALGTISKLLRGAIVAPAGRKLVWGDFGQIEARATVWAAGQQDIVDLFASGTDVYKAMASFIFHKTVEDVTKDDRFIGKTSTLGCGFGIGATKFARSCERMGQPVSDAIAQQAVYGWREKNHKVVAFWYDLEDAVRNAIEAPTRVFKAGPYAARVDGLWLKLKLPSGRLLWYRRPHMVPDEKRAGKHKVAFYGVNSYTKQWGVLTTWGGSLLENVIQATCRDVLVNSAFHLRKAGFDIVLTVHDEMIAEASLDRTKDEFRQAMLTAPDWAAGLPLKTDVDEGERYGK